VASRAIRRRGEGPYGDYLPNAQGEDVVAGIRNTLPVTQLQELDAVGRQLLAGMLA
jgi:pyruvate,orthophosphate dikinase